MSNLSFGQVFITIDQDTDEFIEDVNYTLYKDRGEVFNGVTLSDRPTEISQGLLYDSITFSRVDYETLGLLRKNIDSVIYLKKRIFYLDEVVVGAKQDKSITLGETNRFVKRIYSNLSEDLDEGLVFTNTLPYVLQLDKIVFYVKKVHFKTAYKINFSEMKKTTLNYGNQYANVGDVMYATDTLYLNPKDNRKIEVALPPDWYLEPDKPVFVWIQLLGYYDEDGHKTALEPEMRTRLRFQLSDNLDYYAKMYNVKSKNLTEELININLLHTNYAFSNPSVKLANSTFSAPAIVLYAHKAEPLPVKHENVSAPK
ncbi:hypothetical protein [Flavobacterium rhizosphaerae]|uniref:hypothetical protein n=1 Tax=Flavobacterium rhizosphaerae TaxID=3163298 RepID=UPI0038B5CEBF